MVQVDGNEWRGYVSVPLVSDFESMKATFKYRYGAREYIASKDPKVSSSGEVEEKGDTGDEDVQGVLKDYLSTLAHDSIEDILYLDDDDSTDKINSNHIDVCPWPNIDFVNLDLNSTISNTVYRENEVKCIIETYREL
uniref:Uncharacterized protein n=1 Tax=Vespula pensylvanica TaxID=30213 RepID=A0A834MZP0_VESPE|nr:hypothetical protein H0235_017587 [Vespula pensylvanica]